MKHDINDTLRTEGVDAVRARHDRACRYTNREKNIIIAGIQRRG